jgi:integrase
MFSRASTVIRDLQARGRAASGVPDLQFKQCRTTFGTLFDGDPKDAQDILGHSTVDITMRYYKKSIAERQKASVEELESRLSGKVVQMPIRESA